MKDSYKKQGVSRRKFIKGFGTGVIGSTMLPHILSADSRQKGETATTHDGKELILLKVNGKNIRALIEPRTTLAEFLRDHLNLTGTKIVCNHGECGGCTVMMNGKAVYSCHMLAVDAAGKEITTIEGLMNGENLHPIQEAFVEHDGLQCGFCTPGQIMAAQALLFTHRHPTLEQVKQGMSGNLCRCSAYPQIVDSVLDAAEKNWE